MSSDPIFVDLSDSKPSEIESLCMKCGENVSIKVLFFSVVYMLLTCLITTGYY